MLELSDRAKEIIDAPNYAHIATLLPSGAPLVSPIWVARENDLLLMGTGEGTQKAKNTVRDPRVALSLTGHNNPYLQLQLRGKIIERRPDDDFDVFVFRGDFQVVVAGLETLVDGLQAVAGAAAQESSASFRTCRAPWVVTMPLPMVNQAPCSMSLFAATASATKGNDIRFSSERQMP